MSAHEEIAQASTGQSTAQSSDVLTAAAYDAREKTARRELSNRIVEVFQPVTFGSFGYPVHVDDVEELWKFADVMQENRFEQDFQHLLGGLTEDEFRLFMTVNEAVLGLSLGHFGRPMVARAGLLRALNTFRQIRHLAGDERPPVLEIGSGSGYLAALLALDGFPVIAHDVTQGFYLYQHMLWQAVAPGGVHQVVETDEPLTALANPAPGQVLHIPWWRWYDPEPGAVALSAGLITCNHALCEMHPRSMYYLLLLSRQIMANHQANWGTPAAFAFEGSGSDANVPMWYVNSRFYAYGYGLCHNDAAFTIYAEQDKTAHVAAYPRLHDANLPDAETIARLGEQTVGAFWQLTGFAPLQNPWSARLQAGRQALRPSVDLPTVQAALADLYGGQPAPTPDERFFQIVGIG